MYLEVELFPKEDWLRYISNLVEIYLVSLAHHFLYTQHLYISYSKDANLIKNIIPPLLGLKHQNLGSAGKMNKMTMIAITAVESST